ncbi:MAG: glucoamylase family protein [Candidatus Ancaeobacter aquaticus]|nr:glucoamylase family protein [Candidatus Ancaeobacter aquaticus]
MRWVFFAVCFFVVFVFPTYAHTGKSSVLLIDDFNKRNSYKNLLGGWVGGDTAEPGVCKVSYESNPKLTFGKSGSSLKLAYDVRKKGSYSYSVLSTGNLLPIQKKFMEEAKYLSFWVKGEKGGEDFRIELHFDINGDGRYQYGDDIASNVAVQNYVSGRKVDRSWRKVFIPIRHFKSSADLSKLCEIVFVFDNDSKRRKSTIYIDDILFGTLSLRNDKSNAVLLRNNFYSNGKRVHKVFLYEDQNTVQVKTKGDGAEVVWFELSQDNGKTWQRIDSSYNNGSNVFTFTFDDTKFQQNKDALYIRLSSVTPKGSVLPLKPCRARYSIPRMNTNAFLDLLEKKAFLYFYENQNMETGLFRDCAGFGDSSIAVTGLGLTALCIGAERGWIDKNEARRRVLLTFKTFCGGSKDHHYKAYDKDGFFYHFLKYNTAKRSGKSEISTIDTAMLLCGMITAGEYFGGEIKDMVPSIYKRMDWLAYRDKDVRDDRILLLMGWTPEKGFLKGRWDYYSDETMLVTLLGAGSPNNDVPARIFYDWKREVGAYRGGDQFVYSWYGSLFTYQYAHLWFDLKDVFDREGINWFVNSVRATSANRRFCIDHAHEYKTYSPNMWGITSVALPRGYTMSHGVIPNGENISSYDGTISPLGIGASINFTPLRCMSALHYIYQKYPLIHGKYGFKNACNLDENYYARNNYGLDIGVFLVAVENFRTGFVWDCFMKNKYVLQAMRKTGFAKDVYHNNKSEKIKGIQKGIDSFIKKRHKNAKDINNALSLMEQLIAIGHKDAAKIFAEKYEKVYSTILRVLDNDDLALPRGERNYIRFVCFLRQYRFEEAQKCFDKFVMNLKEASLEYRKYANTIKKYTQRLLTMKMTELYSDQLYKDYLTLCSSTRDTSLHEGIKEMAGDAFYNGSYDSSFAFYKDYADKCRDVYAHDDYLALCGGIALKFYDIKRYGYSAHFDFVKLKCMDESEKKDEFYQSHTKELIKRYYDVGSYTVSKKMCDIFLKSLLASEESPHVLYVRGMCNKKLKRYDEAINDFKAVCASNDVDALHEKALLQLGESYMAMNDMENANECFDKVIENHKTSNLAIIALFNKGLIHYYQNNYQEARKCFSETLQGDTNLAKQARYYMQICDSKKAK